MTRADRRIQAAAQLGIFHRCDRCGRGLPIRASKVAEEREEGPVFYFCSRACQNAWEEAEYEA